MIPSKLKVVELRAELSSRGLDTKGNKAALVERLEKALEEEEKGSDGKHEVSQPAQTPDKGTEENNDDDENLNQEDDAKDDEEVQAEDCQPENDQPTATSPVKPPSSQASPVKQVPASPANQDAEAKSKSETQSSQKNEDLPPKAGSMDVDETPPENVKLEGDKRSDNVKDNLNGSLKEGFEIKAEPMEVKVEGKSESKNNEVKTEKREDRKRKRSPSPRRDQHTPVKPIKEDEPDIKDTDVTLSWYDSDLNLVIDTNSFMEATPMSDGGFGYIWAGVRGTHAYTTGKLCFQVRLKENCNISHLEDEPNPNVLRVGWSALHTSLQLGEEQFSYGFGGTGKVAENCKFSNYGKSFAVGDVVTAYLEFTDQEYVISFDVNDEKFGEAFRVPIPDSDNKGNKWALAPHVLTKNVKFEVNFGQSDPWTDVKPDYTFVGKFPVENAVAGPKRPEKRSDCEMIMMCGLPGCGKTYWADKYSMANPDKHFNILGTNALIDKMKVMGLPRKANYSGRWDVLIEKCTKCLVRLMDVGCHRRRNYILDQTNVYPAAQRRKMRNFEGFIRKAVIIVPTEEDFKARLQMMEKEEKKDVPESAVLEMKANFSLPDKSLFQEVIYTDLQENEAKEMIHKFNKEAAAKGYTRKGPGGQGGGPPVKKFRQEYHQNQRHDYRRGGGPGPHTPGGFRRGGGGMGDRGGPRGGNWAPRGGGPDRWRDNRNHSGGGYRQGGDRGGGWRGAGSMGGRGHRDFERPPRGGTYDRNNRGPNTPARQGGNSFRDSRDNQRGKPKPRGGQSTGNSSMGSTGGTVTTANNAQGQWASGGGQYQPQSSQSGGPQAWNSSGQQQNWGQWGNYQQPFKGFSQGGTGGGYGQQGGYNQQQGYNQPGGYGNWQQYGYPGYNQNWQNSEGNTFGAYQQAWPNWYPNTGPTNTSQPPPSK
ncbi:heterogeneous nuclear ribonucleoprotein U-like protein 1 isoform X2 [Cimex lectularius]|uniref:Uncharacterized protein n=1 Tax=Cimex lectularius TaxID=79782 RepID=A0A8I6RQA0_CIMLE|nr:heterogeneous nuclear ribonucleoprotein U-like protein 1 isoform X2 [Cimex lectularius]